MRPSIFIVALAGAVAFLLAGCEEDPVADRVSVKLNWRHGVDFIGIYVAEEKGYFAEENLAVAIEPLADMSETTAVFDKVVSGEHHFSFGGMSLVKAQARGLPLVAIATITRVSPSVLFARKETGIRTPADLSGKSIAVKNEIWRAVIGRLLERFDLTFEDVVEVPAGFDLQPFYDGDVDVWAGFITNEAVRARLAGINIVTLPLHEYGHRAVERTIYASRGLVAENPDLPERFLRAALRGWRWAIENPAAAVEVMLQRYPAMAGERQFHLASLNATIPLLLPPGAVLGEMNCDRWESHELLGELPDRKETCDDTVIAKVIGEGKK